MRRRGRGGREDGEEEAWVVPYPVDGGVGVGVEGEECVEDAVQELGVALGWERVQLSDELVVGVAREELGAEAGVGGAFGGDEASGA